MKNKVFYTLFLQRGESTCVCRNKPSSQLYAGVFVMMGLFYCFRGMVRNRRILFWVLLLNALLFFSASYAQTTLTPLCQYQAPPGADYINQIRFPYESQPAKRGSDANHDGYDDYIKAFGYTNTSGVDVVCFWGNSVLSNIPN